MSGSIFPQGAYVIHSWLYQTANSRIYQITKKQGIENLMYFNFHSHQHYQQGEKKWKTIYLFPLMHRKLHFLKGLNRKLKYVMIQDGNMHNF